MAYSCRIPRRRGRTRRAPGGGPAADRSQSEKAPVYTAEEVSIFKT